jgi:ABC-type transport system involved in multi-copper enzyme maturation permease subunit
MKTLIINDYRYLRSVLLFWLGLLLLPVLCLAGLHTPLGWSPYYRSSITYAISLLFLAQIITQAVLVSNLVQKENLKNPHAYWLTRPIPRGQLVVAKFISTALWFLLPQFLQISLMALLIPSGLRTPSGILGPVAIPVVLVLCASLVVAGLSRTSGKALMGLTMIPVGLIITDIAGMYFIRIPLQSGLLRILGDSFSVESLLIGLVVILSLGGYTLRYFSHRYRSASAFCLGLAALCLVLTIGLEDPPRIPEATMQLPDEATLRVDGINFLRKWGRDNEFGLVSSGQRSGPAAVWDDDDGGKSYGISAHLHWSGVPEEWFV